MPEFAINWFAIVAAAIADLVIGATWYSPPVFQKPWLAALGKTPEQVGGGWQPIALAAAMALLTGVLISTFLGLEKTLVGGIMAGFLGWLTFLAPRVATNTAFENSSWTLTALMLGHELVALVVMDAILGAWR